MKHQWNIVHKTFALCDQPGIWLECACGRRYALLKDDTGVPATMVASDCPGPPKPKPELPGKVSEEWDYSIYQQHARAINTLIAYLKARENE